MHKIPSTAFAKAGIYEKEKVDYIKKCFTPMRVSINDQIFPRSQKNSDKESHKIGRKIFGLATPETIEFNDTEIRVIDKDKKVVETTKATDVQYIQFGVIRRMTTYMWSPVFYYELTMTLGTSSGNYYLLNGDFAVYEQLKAWGEKQNIEIEDPFELASITTDAHVFGAGDPSTWGTLLDKTFITKVAKVADLNYPEEV
ncbi:Hypothetical protein ADU73_0811 [Pediococcus damnosus]|uniref:hypothetical protein n=1 Tax=Pediococcus damnosus TaxID=51663 RepID=UPI00078E3315|nr:hypothetical protein [Pediococcus damnosus]AMV69217.1 Hypothetical protein ADU73_0811 [Pediococcus damnosus]